jgi:cation transport regulator ChaB
MPYARNAELPETVRAALPEAAQSVWRNVFNERNASGDSEQASIRQALGS